MGTNALNNFIRHEIEQQGGAIPFDRFMELALYHPQYGYYLSGNTIFGKTGDFITAAEISPLFARCIANACRQACEQLQTVTFLELGAGTGRFAGDLLTALADLNPQYMIYEISPILRQRQQALLTEHYPTIANRVTWLESLPEQFEGIILANEVLDALPVHCFQVQSDSISERCVGMLNNQFTWQEREPRSNDFTAAVSALRDRYALPAGYASEINLHLSSFFKSLSLCLQRGLILFSDYGYGQREYYHPERMRGTLTCFHQHQHHDNPLLAPGTQDITAHVDFTHVIDTAFDQGFTLLGYTTQASFLLGNHLLDFAAATEQDLCPADLFSLHHAIKLLTLPTEMGERIKIMALNKNVELTLPGFQQDRRREL